MKGYPRSYHAVYQTFLRPYRPCPQADTRPVTCIDNPPRIPFSVGFVYVIRGRGRDMAYLYTEDAGLPYFDRAAVIANGNW